MPKKLADNIDFRVSDDKGKQWLDSSHIAEVSLVPGQDGQTELSFKTTKEGSTALYNATVENVDRFLSITVDDRLISTARVVVPIEDGKFTVGSMLKDSTYIYNYLTGAADKMKGVTPPDNLISEDDAKIKAFERANVSSEDATELTVELAIDEDYFGWEYRINFKANGKRFKSEVNAYTGNVIRFYF